MSLTPSELAHIATELGLVLPGARVQKLSFADPWVVVLELRIPGRSLLLRLDVSANAHVGVVDAKAPSPERALAVQGLWRSHLIGARVDRVVAVGRTFSLELSTDAGARAITAELDRKGGALLLLDATHRVLGVTPPERTIARGLPYSAPPASEAPDRNRLAGLVPDATTLAVSREAARLFESANEAAQLNQTQTAVLAALRGARKRLTRTLPKVEADRQRISEAARYQQFGDLLKPMLSRLKRGATSAKLTAYGPEGEEEVEVPLLPQLGPRENMERYYHLHRRLSRSAERVDERLRVLRDQLARVEAVAAEAEAETDPARLTQLLEQARRDKLLSEAPVASGPAAQAERVPFREFVSASGQRLWVGRNARDNDALTFRHARGNDLWLHARGQTGSHVVIPGLGLPGTDGETLLEAAELAAHFSAGRDETFVEVSSTRCKYVRKPKGSPPGAVIFSQEKAIQLRRDPERLARVLATERRPGGSAV